MKTLQLTKIPENTSIEHEFLQVERECNEFHLESVNWKKDFPYKPKVRVKIGYNQKGFYLIYKVQEQQTLATRTQLRGDVHNDSCVEFFLSLDEGKSYYNFEFNAIGSIHAAYKEIATGRKQLFTDTQLEQIIVLTPFEKFQPINKINTEWELKAYIPSTLFNEEHLFEKPITANFYKCGDQLEVPHFISWSPIPLEKPNFHCPQYFGKLIF